MAGTLRTSIARARRGLAGPGGSERGHTSGPTAARRPRPGRRGGGTSTVHGGDLDLVRGPAMSCSAAAGRRLRGVGFADDVDCRRTVRAPSGERLRSTASRRPDVRGGAARGHRAAPGSRRRWCCTEPSSSRHIMPGLLCSASSRRSHRSASGGDGDAEPRCSTLRTRRPDDQRGRPAARPATSSVVTSWRGGRVPVRDPVTRSRWREALGPSGAIAECGVPRALGYAAGHRLHRDEWTYRPQRPHPDPLGPLVRGLADGGAHVRWTDSPVDAPPHQVQVEVQMATAFYRGALRRRASPATTGGPCRWRRTTTRTVVRGDPADVWERGRCAAGRFSPRGPGSRCRAQLDVAARRRACPATEMHRVSRAARIVPFVHIGPKGRVGRARRHPPGLQYPAPVRPSPPPAARLATCRAVARAAGARLLRIKRTARHAHQDCRHLPGHRSRPRPPTPDKAAMQPRACGGASSLRPTPSATSERGAAAAYATLGTLPAPGGSRRRPSRRRWRVADAEHAAFLSAPPTDPVA
jgi:hypothetical protein